MTSTDHLGLPFIEGSQAQKHVTHNEALRILDAAIQIAVLDRTRTTPPATPTAGERHIVAIGAGGAWAGQGNAIATWQDGAWAYLPPNTGWCVWSVADDVMLVFDGAHWRDLRNLALDNATRLGINTTASAPNLLSVKSNAALFAAIAAADSGSGDVRIQLSKESAGRNASVYFSDNYSGRAEFGLVGSDAFKLKVSADGSGWTEALTIDQGSGNLTLPRGLSLAGVIAPAQITSNQNDYNPAGLASASVLQISSDAARSVSGLAGGTEGRIIALINVGTQPVTLLDESAASVAANRFTLGGGLILTAKQAALLRYDGTAARWQAIAGGLSVRADAVQGLSVTQQGQARANAGVPGTNVLINGDFRINQRVYASGATLAAANYGHDRWKAGSGGGTYSFTQLASSTQVTIASGKSIVQIVEDRNVEGGSYVLSWSGTAQARVGINAATPSGSYASSPIVVTGQTAGTAMSVEFNAGTLGMAKMEAGTVATPFVMQDFERELSRCQRYFEKSYNLADAPGTATLNGMRQMSVNVASANSYGIPISYQTRKRAAPTVTLYDGAGNAGKCSTSVGDNQAADAATIAGESGFLGRDISGGTTGYIRFHFTASSEL